MVDCEMKMKLTTTSFLFYVLFLLLLNVPLSVGNCVEIRDSDSESSELVTAVELKQGWERQLYVHYINCRFSSADFRIVIALKNPEVLTAQSPNDSVADGVAHSIVLRVQLIFFLVCLSIV